MSGIERISYNMANKIGKKTNKSKEDISIINYGIFTILHTCISMILVVISGYIIGKPIEVITIIFVSSTLKRYSGGAHATSANRCMIIGIIISIIFTYVGVAMSKLSLISIEILSIINLTIAAYIFYRKAPVGNKNKPLKNSNIRNKLRKNLYILLSIYFCIIILIFIFININIINKKYVIHSIYIQCGILLQLVSITNIGETTISKLDSFLIKLTYKGD